jgi:hypothetical protein
VNRKKGPNRGFSYLPHAAVCDIIAEQVNIINTLLALEENIFYII